MPINALAPSLTALALGVALARFLGGSFEAAAGPEEEVSEEAEGEEEVGSDAEEG